MGNTSKRRGFLRSLGIAILFQMGISPAKATSNIYLPGVLINLYLMTQLPLVKDLIIFKMTLTDGDLSFNSDQQRLIMATRVEIAMSGGKTISGKLLCSSTFTYDEIQKTIRLKSPTIDQLKFDAIGSQEQALLQQANPWISKVLDGFIVYEFKEKKKLLLSRPPQKILVEDDGIRFYYN